MGILAFAIQGEFVAKSKQNLNARQEEFLRKNVKAVLFKKTKERGLTLVLDPIGPNGSHSPIKGFFESTWTKIIYFPWNMLLTLSGRS